MSARQPSQAELVSAIAKDATKRRQTACPGIVVSYDPLTNSVDVIPGVIAEDESEPGQPITCPFRVPSYGGFLVGTVPVPGDHVTLIYHGSDPSGFFGAPAGPARSALAAEDGFSCEAWPGSYVPPLTPLTPGVFWLGNPLQTAGVALTPTAVCLGTAAADAPLVRGTELAAFLALQLVYFGLLQTWIASAGPVGPPPVPPPVPPTLLSALVRTT
jgi:hypothetical protein